MKCFSKAGKQLYDSDDDRSAGWFPVNASDPVGIVGEYLEKNKAETCTIIREKEIKKDFIIPNWSHI